MSSPGNLFLGPCDFTWGAANPESLPPAAQPEIAFAGRSNVGKSSLINALTGRKDLARTSKTPGRTQQLNFFDVGGRLVMVDMPGYGYAKVSKQIKAEWDDLIMSYLRGRPTLRCVFLLIDARHGLKPNDVEVMKMLDSAAVSYRIVLTKADKIKGSGVVDEVTLALKKHTAAFPDVFLTSSEEKTGIEELRDIAASYADL